MILLILVYLFFENLWQICTKCCQRDNEIEKRNLLKKTNNNSYLSRLKYFFWVLMVFFVITIMMIPSIFPVVIQYWALSNFTTIETEADITIDNTFLLKVMVICIFIFLIIRRAFQILNVIFLLSMKVYDSLNKNYWFIIKALYILIVISPQFMFYYLCWSICYYSMIYIANDTDVIDIIQNFAGFFVLLEFSGIIVLFLKSLNFDVCFNYFVNEGYVREIINYIFPKFQLKKTFDMILKEDTFYLEDGYEKIESYSLYLK